jgi:hypothetical protein
MIDPQWSVVDLDPRTWRNIGKYFDPGQYIRAAQPNEHGLFVLHEDGRLLRTVDNLRGVRRDLVIPDCKAPQELARRLFGQGEWDRVHVINKRHLADVARRAQATPRRELTLDGYYHLVYRLLWDDSDGYVCVPPHPGHWHGWTYTGVRQFVDQLPAAATLALGVFDDEAVSISLILELRDGMIRRVTTFEGLELPPSDPRLSAKFLDQLWSCLEAESAPPAGVLLCSASAFNAWIAADDKAAFLQRVSQEGAAHWRLRLAVGGVRGSAGS